MFYLFTLLFIYHGNPFRYHNEIRTFSVLAKQCADLSISKTVLYDNNIEANPIQFSVLEDSKLGNYLLQLIYKFKRDDDKISDLFRDEL